MEAALAHRGPDARGYLLHRRGGDLAVADRLDSPALTGPGPAIIGLAHRRLSIIDLSHENDQPLLDASGRYGLSYNGEVYNYVELRDELEALGHAFRTEGDTEVVLNSYKQWGPDRVLAAVRRHVGVRAGRPRAVQAAHLARPVRDQAAVFIWASGGALRFASEIKALVADGGIELRPNLDAVRQFLLIGRGDASDRSFFDGIFHLPPAHSALVDLADPGSVRPVEYWAPPSEGQLVAPDWIRPESSPSGCATRSGCTCVRCAGRHLSQRRSGLFGHCLCRRRSAARIPGRQFLAPRLRLRAPGRLLLRASLHGGGG